MRTEIKIDGADATGANYITWAPVHSSIRVVEADGGVNPVDVVLRNRNPAEGGQIVFRDVIPGAEQDTLRLSLPADGTPVDFFIAGKPGRPSVDDKDAVIEAVGANTEAEPSTAALMVRVRKNANNLTDAERDRFLSAFAILNDHGRGKFRDFRDMHTEASSDEAHFRPGFLPWHRAYLLDLERELQQIDPSVALPYWKFDEPAPNLFSREFVGVPNGLGRVQFEPGNPLESWTTDGVAGIERFPLFNTNTSPAGLPTGQTVSNETDTLGLGNVYADFVRMERNPHGRAHVSFTGFIQDIHTAARDPLFFLLHTNVDRLWTKWQWLLGRFDTTDPAAYPLLGSAGTAGADRVGHNRDDFMWPWEGDEDPPRPPTAPGGKFPASPTEKAPGPTPTVGDMIDYRGLIDPGSRLGFDYDDLPSLQVENRG